MYNKNIIKRFVRLKARNLTNDKISSILNVSERTLVSWNKKYLKEILLHQQLELDEIKNSLKVADFQQLEFYSKIIQKCQDMLLSHNFDDSFDKIFKMYSLAVNQVQKCKVLSLEHVNIIDKSEQSVQPKIDFNPLFFNNLLQGGKL